MTAEMICYIQPTVAVAAGTAWVDTAKTAVVRRMVASKSEADCVVSEARDIARALGGGFTIKKMVRALPGKRRFAGFNTLQGAEIVA